MIPQYKMDFIKLTELYLDFSDSSRDRFHNSIQYTDKQANRSSTRGGYSTNEMPILETNQSPKDSGHNIENDSSEKAA